MIPLEERFPLARNATRRRQLGTTVDAACGQLHAKYLVINSRRVAPVDTEPIPITPVSC
ncbi:hypothetical protein ACF1FX_19210 [Streptomyces sp. NPDC014646]|uniref:hypothetical protein n=1 Tax=unclassified Streptomyces TaxID=2593676 RepID=UPI00370354B9